MKVKIVIEDGKKGVIEIPISKNDINDLFSIGYMMPPDLDLNDAFKRFHKKLARIIDALQIVTDLVITNDKIKKHEDKFYHSGKKPRWKK